MKTNLLSLIPGLSLLGLVLGGGFVACKGPHSEPPQQALTIFPKGPNLSAANPFTPPPGLNQVDSADGSYRLFYKILANEVIPSQEFGLRFWVCQLVAQDDQIQLGSELSSVQQVRVDAAMPHHKHGMNLVPITQAVDAPEGGFVSEGLLFHMPGYWEIYVDISDGAWMERAQFSLEIN